MSGSGKFATSRSDTGDRTNWSYRYDNFRSNQMAPRQQLRSQNIYRQSYGKAVADADNRSESDYSNATLSLASLLASSSLSSPSMTPKKITNLDSFLESVTPVVPAQNSSEMSLRGHVSREAETESYFCLEDLWETFREGSAYGVGVPFLLFGTSPTTQFYTPYLSGMQLYIDPEKTNVIRSSGGGHVNLVKSHLMDGSFVPHKLKNLKHQVPMRDNKREVCFFEYMEQDQPHCRRPLSDKVFSDLAFQFPELRNYKSCDLSPSSWICIAWYPIYRIPLGPTLKDLEASFLTFHSLSTQPGSYSEAECSSTSSGVVHDDFNSSGFRLPVIGLASYKLKGSIISPHEPREQELEKTLLEAANNWLQHVHALLPDYQFFLNRY